MPFEGAGSKTHRDGSLWRHSDQRWISVRGDHSSPWRTVGLVAPTKAVSLVRMVSILLVNGGKEEGTNEEQRCKISFYCVAYLKLTIH